MLNLFNSAPSFVDWINQGGDPSTERNIGGVVPAYPIFMFAGIMLVIIASIIKLKQRKIPLAEFEWGILIVVPIGILGGTIFGKIFIPNMVWYRVFFFWEPGMSLFGALTLGTVAGFAWFYRRSKITKISVWVYADCILPNILLGQALGRWGNLYNHEILGPVVNYDSLSWLVPTIRDKLWYFPQELGQVGSLPSHWWIPIIVNNGGVLMNPQQISSTLNITLENAQKLYDALGKNLEYRQPFFLYESLLNLFYWFILTFFVANLSRFFQKKGNYPWDFQPKAFPGWYNSRYKSLPEKEIISWKTQIPVKYKRVLIKKDNGDEVYELKIPFFSAWNKAYYFYELDWENETKLLALVDERNEKIDLNENLLEKNQVLHQKNLKKLKQSYRQKLALNKKNKTKYQQLLVEKKTAIAQEKENYRIKKAQYLKNLGGFWYKIKPNPLSKKIEKAYNPHRYFILRCGVLSGSYVFGYTFYRTILEAFREPREYFIQNYAIPNFIVLSLIICFGLALILWAQWGAPYKYRDLGWLYEKSY